MAQVNWRGHRENHALRRDVDAIAKMVRSDWVSRFFGARGLFIRGVPISSALRLLAGVKMGAIDTRNEAFFQHRDSGKMGTQHNLILARIKASNAKFGPHDFSLREIAAITGLDINAVSGRCHELKQSGELVEQKQRACKVTHRTITPLALAESIVVAA